MKHKNLTFNEGFRVAVENQRSQACEMVIAVGCSEGGTGNRHHGADQWFFVASGTGFARINGRKCPLKPGTLILIEHGDVHEITNTGQDLLCTLNIYVPPGYRRDGSELPVARA